MQNPIITTLATRVRRAGSAPLLTWYRTGDGARTELSATTVANWVDKTANLLDTLGVESVVEGRLSHDHPGHWMSAIWPLAAWQRGLGYTTVPAAEAELVVTGPEAVAGSGRLSIACSLHPLGLGLPDLPAGVLDYTGEALAEPDLHLGLDAEPGATAWQDAERVVSHAGLAELPASSGRLLVRPESAWQVLSTAVLGPILGGGSAVIVEGAADADTLTRIAAAERATLA